MLRSSHSKEKSFQLKYLADGHVYNAIFTTCSQNRQSSFTITTQSAARTFFDKLQYGWLQIMQPLEAKLSLHVQFLDSVGEMTHNDTWYDWMNRSSIMKLSLLVVCIIFLQDILNIQIDARKVFWKYISALHKLDRRYIPSIR